MSYINPLRSRRSSDRDEEGISDFDDMATGSANASSPKPNEPSTPIDPEIAPNPAVSLSERGHQVYGPLTRRYILTVFLHYF